MITHGDTVINFTKVKGTQLADIRTVIRRRPKTKFSTGLSMEAQEAMQQVLEESRIEENARRGKRGSKANVLFSDTVQIRRGSSTSKLGFFDVMKDTSGAPRTPRASRTDGKVSVTSRLDRRGSLSLAVDQIELANRPPKERKSSELKKEERTREDGTGKLKRSQSSTFAGDKLPRSGTVGSGS